MLPAFASAQFAPKNDLWKEDAKYKKTARMTKEEFLAISDKVVDHWKPLAELHNGSLSVNANWDDATVNASADQQGDDWVVNMYGGLARRPEVTVDGYVAVICHELGHHFGGFSFYGRTDWAAAEGQSDYFATQACLPELWAGETAENAAHRATVSAPMKAKCDAVWTTEKEQNLCYRIGAAGQSLANLLAKLGQERTPDVTKPDPAVVRRTDVNHPKAQCRLDTYMNGALCKTDFDLKIIPARNNANGQTSKAAQDVAAQYSCLGTGNMSVGERPRCWFFPIK
ncbi:MAG TPA: hypothetical protein VM598_09420 [Bdellovibrionota bacterium]|nr:hypothetical protein [Bdellovibrionota bacterium]